MAELKAGVAGAGAFGHVHARKYAGMEGVRLLRIFDPHPERAQLLADVFGAEPVSDLDAFVEGLDLVSVAAPAQAHGKVGLAALAAGAHLYVEKPLAVTLAEADALNAAAVRAGRVLACGHQERVVARAMGLLDLEEAPLRWESRRFSPANTRNRDVSCVLDLMIHDLDLALAVAGAQPVVVEAEGAFDAVTAEVTFDTGLTAAFKASREALIPARSLELELPSGAVRVDFLAPGLVNASSASLDPGFAHSDIVRDAVGASLQAFVAAVRGQGTPFASGMDGARALDLALAVEHAAGL